MKFIRTVVATMVALAVALGLAAVSVAPAHAAKPPHGFSKVDGGEVRDSGTFFAKGKLTTGKRVFLQRKNGGAWRTFKSDRVNRRDRFYMRFTGPIGSCYRVMAKKNRKHRTTYRVLGCLEAG